MKNYDLSSTIEYMSMPYIERNKGTINKEKFSVFIIVFSYILSISVAIFVYVTGGTTKVYANLMYIPIAINSTICGKKQGLFHAIISGMLIGPFMPLDVASKLNQQTLNWIIRLVIYSVIAIIIGWFSDYSRRNKKYITNILTYDTVSSFKNLDTIRHESKLDGMDKTFIALVVKDYEQMLSLFGYNFSNDMVLEFSKQLKAITKKYGNIEVYRYHGMEFLLKITHNSVKTDVNDIIELLDTLNKSIIKVRNIPIYIELRIGIASSSKNVSVLEGVRHALIALRYATINDIKVKYFEPLLETHYKNVVGIASTFKNALKNKNIKSAYQYIYSSSTDRIYGAELLTRWIKEDNTQIYPNEFISVIENTDLIHDLTKHTIDKAIEFLLSNQCNCCIISINFSAKQFYKENVDYLIEKISKNNINPRQIQVEITEETLINKDYIMKYLQLLKDYGVIIALDDFGAGYSSYQCISELPIDVVKIDKSLIEKIDNNVRSRKIVESIAKFCQETNIMTVAEGVETKEIADICKKIGIDLLQGYYYHKPEIFNT